jgi:hypothetical protein
MIALTILDLMGRAEPVVDLAERAGSGTCTMGELVRNG